ncbi:hypothetical protein QWY76_13235 [Halomonas maura]|nr:hypothetical protein [Halomonas maura]MDN3556949.1 hypothetical protein [Halomonas maura]
MGADRLTEPPFLKGDARQADGALQRGVGDDDIGPERFQQLVLADHPPFMAHEVVEQIEHPGLQGNLAPLQAQLTTRVIQLEVGKTSDHRQHPAISVAILGS